MSSGNDATVQAILSGEFYKQLVHHEQENLQQNPQSNVSMAETSEQQHQPKLNMPTFGAFPQPHLVSAFNQEFAN